LCSALRIASEVFVDNLGKGRRHLPPRARNIRHGASPGGADRSLSRVLRRGRLAGQGWPRHADLPRRSERAVVRK
jgi:hypothetical protein